jgi:AraC family transcriptional regulator
VNDDATTRLLLVDAELAIGEFVCPPGDRRWRDENDIGEGFHVVYPWTPVHIARRAMPGTVATPNHAVLYQPRLRFHRRHLCGEGDHCLFVVLSPGLCDQLVPAAGDAAARRDPVLSPALWMAQRLLAEYLRRSDHDPAIAAAMARDVLRRTLAGDPGTGGECPAGAAVEHVQELIAAGTGQPQPLEQLAREAHYSRFHLLRAFHARTGYTVHQYHLQLRLRRSVDLVLAGGPLSDVAFGLGFQGHSHFTARFHRAFGRTPSAVRDAVAAGDAVPALVGDLLAAA